jgi:outer membrane protein OmpA-like peptidoglycan-associated protein
MKTKRFLFSTLFAIFFFMANANAIDFGKVAKKARQVSANLEQIAKKFEKLQSDKIKVSEDERGVVLTFSVQLFAVGKADLISEAKENLLEVAKTLAEYPSMDIEIEGHTDSTGSAKLNQDLSEKRAKNVMNFLIEQGIAKERLSAVGYGKDRPIADNETEAGRSINRRVELVVKEKVEQKEEVPKEAKEKDPIRFGARANIGSAFTGLEVRSSYGNTESVDGGLTLGFGAFSLIPIWGIYFVPEISLQYRVPISNFKGYTLKETGIDIPLLFRFRYREENLIYLGIGPLLGCVLSSYYNDSDREYLNEYRERVDYGLAMELGFRINNNFSVDIRILGSFASIGFGEFVEISGESGTLNQFQIGVNYVF